MGRWLRALVGTWRPAAFWAFSLYCLELYATTTWMARDGTQPSRFSRAEVNFAALRSPRSCLKDSPRNDAVGKSRDKHLRWSGVNNIGAGEGWTYILIASRNVFRTFRLPTQNALRAVAADELDAVKAAALWRDKYRRVDARPLTTLWYHSWRLFGGGPVRVNVLNETRIVWLKSKAQFASSATTLLIATCFFGN